MSMVDEMAQLPVGIRNDDDTVTITWPNGRPDTFEIDTEIFESLIEQCNIATRRLALLETSKPRNRSERRHGRR